MDQREVLKMDANQVQNWVAYFALQGEEYRKSIEKIINNEKQTALTDAERGKQILALFGKR